MDTTVKVKIALLTATVERMSREVERLGDVVREHKMAFPAVQKELKTLSRVVLYAIPAAVDFGLSW